MKYCLPAKVYLGLTLFSLFLVFTSNVFTPGSVASISVFKIIFSVLWFFFLNWLCSKGLSRLSWFLVLFPFIIMIIVLFSMIYVVTTADKIMVQETTIPVFSSAAGTPVVINQR
jgi:hypothetical protein